MNSEKTNLATASQWKKHYPCFFLIFSLLALPQTFLSQSSANLSGLDTWSDSVYHVYYHTGALSLSSIDSVLVQYPRDSMTVGKEKLYRILATYHQNRGRPEMSFPYLLQIQESVQSRGDSNRLALILGGIAECYRAFGDLTVADSLIDKALLISHLKGDKLTEAYVHSRAGAIKFELDKRDSANIIPHILKAVELYKEIGNQTEVGSGMADYANTLYESGEADRAIRVLDKVVSEMKDSIIIARIFITKARVYLGYGKLDSTLHYAGIAHRIADQYDIDAYEIEAATLLEDAYEELGELQEALRWSRINRGASIEFHSEMRTHDARVVQLQYDREKQLLEKEHLISEAELQQQNLSVTRWLFVAISIITLMLIVFVIWLYKQQRQLHEANLLVEADNKKVKSANRDLEQFIQTRDKLLSAVAHDMRAPLATVRSLVEVMRDEQIPEAEMNHILTVLEAQYQRSLNMADNMILWMKSQLQGIEPKSERVHVMHLIEEVIALVKPIAEELEVEIEVRTSDHAQVNIDPEMFKFILRNLMSNAVKFSRKAEVVSIDVFTEGTNLTVAVEDRGEGMSADKVQTLFSDFEAGVGDFNRKGAGIGLYLCNHFAQLIGAKISATSEKGKGSIFRLEIKTS